MSIPNQSRKAVAGISRKELEVIIEQARRHGELLQQLRAAVLADEWDAVLRLSRELSGIPETETTQISAENTADEIAASFLVAGATGIATVYAEEKVVGLRWSLAIAGVEAQFYMPVRLGPAYWTLRRGRVDLTDKEDAELWEAARRVAWRQLLHWVRAQFALINSGALEAGEAFFPYLQMPSGRSAVDVLRGGLQA